MKLLATFAALLLIPTIASAQTASKSTSEPQPKLWAAITVPRPLLETDQLKQFFVSFALANDGNAAVDPKTLTWQLLVNGKEHPDCRFTFANGPRDKQWESLPPGHHLLFTYSIGEWSKEPGTYTIIWKGEGFESAPIVFRVLRQNK